MQIDRDALREQYRSMPDGELLALDRSELTELAQKCYDAEMAHRQLTPDAEEDAELSFDDGIGDEEAEPDWVESAECACAFNIQYGSPYAEQGEKACEFLRAAQVPCRVLLEDPSEGTPGLLKVMVPGALHLKAESVLDKEMFNAELEDTWRTHMEHLSDSELRQLHPDAVCAGLLDRAARLKRVYEEEVRRRRG